MYAEIYELRIKKYTIYAKCVLRTSYIVLRIKNIRVYIFKYIRKDLYDIRNTIRSVFLEAATKTFLLRQPHANIISCSITENESLPNTSLNQSLCSSFLNEENNTDDTNFLTELKNIRLKNVNRIIFAHINIINSIQNKFNVLTDNKKLIALIFPRICLI